ncbi:N-carbamoyl-L-amino acid hydrolase [Phyllosticta citribraziliensis]
MLSVSPSPRSFLAVRHICHHHVRTRRPLSLFSTPRRAFSNTSRRNLRAIGLSEKQLANMKVNGGRLMEELHRTCAFGTGQRWGEATTDTGMSRLSLTDSDKQVRDWFVDATRALGCHTTVDQMGNIFAVRRGRRDGPATFAGSHLDTQPAGGRYDGILGVLAGVEMLKTLVDNDVETEYPVGVVNWTNEEGARFPISMVSSGVWAGVIPLERAHNLQEVGRGTATMKSELERIGYLGTTPASHEAMPMAAHFELHIEQGPKLEATEQKIGVVQGVQGYRWFTVDVRGRESHSGTTDLANRADALLTASKLILHSHRLAARHDALATTGILTLSPGSVNTVPGSVRFSLDIRSPDEARLQLLDDTIRQHFAAIARGGDEEANVFADADAVRGLPCDVSITEDSRSQVLKFDAAAVAAVRKTAERVDAVGGRVIDMTSGAGHDSVYASVRCPTAMVFVPSRDGISHNPREWTSAEDCALGAQVLMGAVLEWDRSRAAAAIGGDGAGSN